MRSVLGILLCWGFAAGEGVAGPTLVDAVYRADTFFPEYLPFWTEGWMLKDASGDVKQHASRDMPRGGGVHVYLRNAGSDPLTVKDVLVEGVSLTRAVAASQRTIKDMHPASVFFAGLADGELDRLLKAGEPIWWRVEPNPVPPGSIAEAYVRFRRLPEAESVRIAVETSDGRLESDLQPMKVQPSLAAVSFGPRLDEAFVYVRPHARGLKPARVHLDGANVTDRCDIAADAVADVTPLVVRLKDPLTRGSFHCFQVASPDGARATATIRAFADPFVYGMWGYRNNGNTPEERAREYMSEWARHNLNTHMGSYGPGVKKWLSTPEGRQFAAEVGIRAMTSAPGNVDKPFAYFLMDEPDCRDYRLDELPLDRRVGAMAQPLSRKSRELRAKDLATPHLLNVDLTFKPDNWYVYGQLPDIMAADPYYINRLKDSYWRHASRLPLYTRPTYVHAIGRVCRSACAPRPLHLILNSASWDDKENGRRFRYSTPEEKRIEAYYALAAGATGISYWWFTPYGTCRGCGADEEPAHALMREIGLLGAELRTAGPVLVRSCPVDLPVTASRYLWVRTLLSSIDTVVVLCVNNDHLCDREGTLVHPLGDPKLTVRLPSWLEAKDVFEVTHDGIRDIGHSATEGGLAFALGPTELTRMLLVTSDGGLRGRLQALYDASFADNVRRLRRAQPWK